MPKDVACPGTKDEELVREGEGFGSSQQDGVDDARSNARKKLDLDVKNYRCVPDGCGEPTVTADPDYDKEKYACAHWPEADSKGYRCTVRLARPVHVVCAKKTALGPLPPGEEYAGLDLEELGGSDCNGGELLAYVSLTPRVIRIRSRDAKKALAALSAKKEGKLWKLEDVDQPFELTETDGDATTDEQKEPKLGERRVLDDRKCGHRFPASTGKCRPLTEGLWGRIDRTPHARCVITPDKQCVEVYQQTGTMNLYRDSSCSKPIQTIPLYGWSCLILL